MFYMKGFIDIHTHILPGIDDDGPPDLESALELAEGLSRQGFETAVATPHCFEGVPTAGEIEERCRQFNAEPARRKIALQVLPGAELALGIDFLQHYLDQTIKGTAEIQELPGLTVLGTIPVMEDD